MGVICIQTFKVIQFGKQLCIISINNHLLVLSLWAALMFVNNVNIYLYTCVVNESKFINERVRNMISEFYYALENCLAHFSYLR